MRRDLNGDGAATTADAPLSGVEVAVYADTNQNGRIDPEEMSAAATTVSNPDGSYVIEGLPANAYVVEAIPLPGATAVADTDGGKPDQTAVIVGSAPLASVDFLQSLSADTFSQWQSQNGLGGENGAGDNPDADGFDNIVEYALGSDPSSGVQATARFHLEATAGIDAVLMRPAQGRNDVRYALEGSTDMKLWTRLGTTSTATITGDDEVLRFAGLASDAVFTGKAMGYVRLRVDLDADHNGTAEATGYSPVHAFGLPVFGAAQTTFSMPLVRDEIFAGTVGSGTGQSLAISKGSGLKDLLAKAGECYVEVVSGAFAGQRFDLNEASTTDAQLSIDLSNARNTSSTLPGAITSERVVVRPHWTLGALLPAASFHAATSASAADRVLFFENGGYSVHWLMAVRDGTRWVRTGDAKLEDAGVTRIIAGAEGMFVQSRTGSITVPVVGVVPVVRLVQRAATSSIMTGSGTARAIAISEMAGAKTGDKLRMWLGDSVPGAMSFSGLTKSINGWTQDTDGAAAGSVQLPPFRAVFFTPVSATAVSGAP